jgi:hypothetical protein
MTKQQAKIALELGYKVTHSTFLPDEYIVLDLETSLYKDECSCAMSTKSFWSYRTESIFDHDWFVVAENVYQATSISLRVLAVEFSRKLVK